MTKRVASLFTALVENEGCLIVLSCRRGTAYKCQNVASTIQYVHISIVVYLSMNIRSMAPRTVRERDLDSFFPFSSIEGHNSEY